MSLGEMTEIRTSDGILAVPASCDAINARVASYATWYERVRGKRPLHDEFVSFPAEPLNWTALAKPLTECTVALVTTGGVHLREQTPFAVYEEVGDWSWR